MADAIRSGHCDDLSAQLHRFLDAPGHFETGNGHLHTLDNFTDPVEEMLE